MVRRGDGPSACVAWHWLCVKAVLVVTACVVRWSQLLLLLSFCSRSRWCLLTVLTRARILINLQQLKKKI